MTSKPLDPQLRQAIQMFQAGRLVDAGAEIQKFLARSPRDVNGMHLLGVVLLRRNQVQAGIDALGEALRIKPRFLPALLDRGRALAATGRFEMALKDFDKALAVEPANAELHNARGIMLSHLKRSEEAIVAFRRATGLDSRHASAHNNLGNELLAHERYAEALPCFTKAIALQPGVANFYNSQGGANLYLNRFQDALASFDKAIELDAGFVHALTGRGLALAHLKRPDDALASFDAALAYQPENLDGWHNKAKMLSLLGRHEDALACCERALGYSAENADLLSRQGKSLTKLGRHIEALTSFEQALALDSGHVAACTGKAEALRELGRHSEALAAMHAAVAEYPNCAELWSGLLFNMNYADHIDPVELHAWHARYGERFEAPLKAAWQPHSNTPDTERPLRLGFVSGDLRNHPVGYFMESVFAALRQRSGLELYAYANQPNDDERTQRIHASIANWRDINELPDDDVDAMIRNDAIDILVDLSGHTNYHRLQVFARKPAPVQVTYLGYFASTGLTAMDYILGNRWLMPDGDHNCYTETPYRLPDAHLCFTPPNLDIAVAPLPALANGFVTFGNFNKLAKLSDEALSITARVLAAVPNSRLLLKSGELAGEAVTDRVLLRFAEHGIDGSRIMLEGRSPYADYLMAFGKVDIALDPHPYNGGTTTVEGLWMGVPTLTLMGDRYVSRMGTSIMQTLGAPEWVAADVDDYVARARAFAGDLAALAAVRVGLRAGLLASPLCDATGFAGHLEKAFRIMWQRHCQAGQH